MDLFLPILKNKEDQLIFQDILNTSIGRDGILGENKNISLMYQVYYMCQQYGLMVIHQLLIQKKWESWDELLFALPPFLSIRKEQEERYIFSVEIKEASEGLYPCSHCGSTDTIYREVQTRSADEPATIFITCNSCGKRTRR